MTDEASPDSGPFIARPELDVHPDRLRWNRRFAAERPTFEVHPIVADSRAAGTPDGPVLELACGWSGSALAFAGDGRSVVAIDISDVALGHLGAEATRRGLDDRIVLVHADVPSYRPGRGRFAFVLATYYWDPVAFQSGCAAVAVGGLLGWEALVRPEAGGRPARPWEIEPGGLSVRLPDGFDVLAERTIEHGGRRSTRLLARRVTA